MRIRVALHLLARTIVILIRRVDRELYGVHGPYLHTQDFSALEPGVVEDKYYAPGVGLVLVLKKDGTVEVLVSIKRWFSL